MRPCQTMARTFLPALTLAGALLIPAFMNAQVDRTKAPQPGPAPKVNLGAHTTFTLANGMRVIVVENHKLPTVGIQVKFDIEPIVQGDLAGYQDLMGELLASGTQRRTKQKIDEHVDALGGRVGRAVVKVDFQPEDRRAGRCLGRIAEHIQRRALRLGVEEELRRADGGRSRSGHGRFVPG